MFIISSGFVRNVMEFPVCFPMFHAFFHGFFQFSAVPRLLKAGRHSKEMPRAAQPRRSWATDLWGLEARQVAGFMIVMGTLIIFVYLVQYILDPSRSI